MTDNSENTKITDEPSSILTCIKRMFQFQKGSSLKEAIGEVLEEHTLQEATELDEENVIFYNLLRFTELRAKDIMMPRTDIEGVEYSIELPELKEILLRSDHTRFPVYKESMDHVIGFLHLKDVIPYLDDRKKPFVMEDVLRNILVVPPSKKAMDIMMEMRADRVHMAIVIDEYGGTDGLITLEDVFEEIVGDIQDEHDEEEVSHNFALVDENVWEADARVEIKQLEEAIGQDVRNGEDFGTIGGLIFFIAGYVPKEKEIIAYEPAGLEIEILDADPRSVKKVQIRKVNKEK